MNDDIAVLVAAHQEAFRLWGPSGHAEIDRLPGQPPTAKVGVLRNDASMEVRGRGRTFREAFDDAHQKASA